MKLLFDVASDPDSEPDSEQSSASEPIFLNLGTLLYEEARDRASNSNDSASFLHALLPKLRLLVACERKKERKLDGVFTLLECGVLVPEVMAVKDGDSLAGETSKHCIFSIGFFLYPSKIQFFYHGSWHARVALRTHLKESLIS
jgi:hypothetical protein